MTTLPTGTRYLQVKGGAVAVTPDDRVYLSSNGVIVELVPAQAPPPPAPELTL
jgi:hypothetical protein